MTRTTSSLCLAAVITLTAWPGTSLGGNADPVARAQRPPLKTQRVHLRLDPVATLAGAVKCACLRDLLFPLVLEADAVPRSRATSLPLNGPRLADQGSPLTISPTLIDDRLGLSIHLQW